MKKLLLATLVALGFASAAAWAGMDQRQLDNGALCYNQNGSADRLCFSGGVFNYFEICGDIATINANTIYYGPSQAVIDSATVARVTCNSDASGNATEATADEPALTATAFYPLGMTCYSTDMGATGSPMTFELRSAAASLKPAISLSIADNVLSATSSPSGTSLIAAGATVSIGVTSAGDVGAGAFYCRVFYAS
ncbi:MAG: hypothetical protein Q8L53_16760 [Aestuariivirga sp.]|nr:hypothetical protein [Aestuariivirga sp.]